MIEVGTLRWQVEPKKCRLCPPQECPQMFVATNFSLLSLLFTEVKRCRVQSRQRLLPFSTFVPAPHLLHGDATTFVFHKGWLGKVLMNSERRSKHIPFKQFLFGSALRKKGVRMDCSSGLLFVPLYSICLFLIPMAGHPAMESSSC